MPVVSFTRESYTPDNLTRYRIVNDIDVIFEVVAGDPKVPDISIEEEGVEGVKANGLEDLYQMIQKNQPNEDVKLVLHVEKKKADKNSAEAKQTKPATSGRDMELLEIDLMKGRKDFVK